jgi:hypothetical protein
MDTKFLWSDLDRFNDPIPFHPEELQGLTIREAQEWGDDDDWDEEDDGLGWEDDAEEEEEEDDWEEDEDELDDGDDWDA